MAAAPDSGRHPTGMQPAISVLPPPRIWHPRQFRVVAVLVVILLVLVIVRLSAILSPSNDRLVVHVGNQAVSLLDLRQSTPISPYLFGANVFPEIGTSSVDKSQTGFMSYGPSIVEGLRNANVKLLRFPGGSWGEDHLLSYDQLDAFSTLLSKTGAQGMIQARLNASPGNRVPGITTMTDRAHLAGRWVDYMNNVHSDLRTGKHASAPVYPVTLWTVGNEPDMTVNPDTGKQYTVAEYVDDFIQFSIQMHQNNPTIQVFGPEVTQFNGLGVGPVDANGKLWMEGFITGVRAYETAHPDLKFHLLDGVSFHFYPDVNPQDAASLLMTNSDAWTYLLEPLRQFVRQNLNRDVPVAVTEINSSTTKQAPPKGRSALWWADTLGTLMNQDLQYLAFFSAEGVPSPYPLFTGGQLRPTSMLRVLELYSHLQPGLVPLASEHNPVSIYATEDAAHQTVSLLFVNKVNSPQLAQVSADNQVFGARPWPSQDISLAPLSITLITLRRGGGADAYSYDVAVIDDTGAPPLTHTVCGKKTDALAYQTPC